MEKLTRYHIKHIQSVAEGVISEYTVNTLIRTNGSTSFVMTFKCMFGSYLRVGGEMIG